MNTKRKKKNSWKLPISTFFIFFLCIFILFLQMGYISLFPTVYGKNMEEFASTRNTVRKTVKASRGNIYDTNENLLALNVSSYTLIAYLDESRSKNSATKNHVEDIETTANALAQVLETDAAKLKEILENGKEKKRYQVEFGNVGKGITELKKDEILALNLPGISFSESQKRYYPNGRFASYVLGYAKDKEVTEEQENGEKVTMTQITGELGIEAKYDDLLKGTDGYLEYQRDRYGYKIAGTKEINIPAQNGADIYLTIDSNIERFVETEVEEVEKKYEPEWMILTVMNAKTGEILGASSAPSFDPNVRDVKNYENPFATTAYEPGSTMKIYTYMCALETGNYDGNYQFQSGSIKIGDNTINDWNGRGWGKITLDKGFEYSSNVGVVNLIQQYLTREQLRECLKKYGFGKTTGIEFTRESAGQINFNYEIEVATAGFGQGIKTTVAQQLQAASLLANEGKMLKPHIVKKIIDPTTSEVYYESGIDKTEQFVKKSTVEKVKELMYNTIHGTDPGTAGTSYNIEGFDLIGKTGTAQIYEPGKGYLKGDNNYIFSAIVIFPKDDPELIIYGAMKKPKYGKYAGLATAVKNLVKNISKYKNIYDDNEQAEEVNSLVLKSYIGKNTVQVVKDLESYHFQIETIGSGEKIIAMYPSPHVTLVEGDRLLLFTNDTEYKMPDITAWSRSEVKTFADTLGIELEMEGYGFAKTQSIEKGKKITNDTKLKVTFASEMEE